MAKLISVHGSARSPLSGNLGVTKAANTKTDRMAILLWGSAGCGKTTFAATAPGNKLWLSFGDQEHVSIRHRTDVEVVHLAELPWDELFLQAQNDNPFGLDKWLSDNDDIHTVVVDSSTAIAFRALQKAVAKGIGKSARDGFVPTMEAPGIGAYGGRNAIVLTTLTGLLRVTARHGVNIIITAHEDDPKEDKQGTVEYITTQLGGKLVNNMTWRLSEIWYMSREGHGDRHRRIAIRPTRLRRPMKTRMFTDAGEPEFILDYDATKPDEGQMTITEWYEQWTEENGKLKIPVVKSRSTVKSVRSR